MNKIIAVTAILFAVIIGLGLYVNGAKEAPTPVDTSKVLQIQADDHVVGDVNSSVVLFEYLDLQCPACAAFHPIMNQVKAANPDIAVVTRHFPLHFHRNARMAGAAAEAAGAQGQFDQMVEKQFEEQTLWSGLGTGAASDIFERYAQELGLDIDAFNAYRSSDVALNKVSQDFNGGTAIGVNSTPTFMLQGEKIRASSVQEFQELIDAAKSAVQTETQKDIATPTEEL